MATGPKTKNARDRAVGNSRKAPERNAMAWVTPSSTPNIRGLRCRRPTMRSQLAQEAQYRGGAALGFRRVEVVAVAVEDFDARIGDLFAHGELVAQRGERAVGGRENQGRHLHARQQRLDLDMRREAGEAFEHVALRAVPLAARPLAL